MKCYIETKDETKIEFCNRTGEKVSLAYVIQNFFEIINKAQYPVAIIKHTEGIIAAPILYNKMELKRLLTDYGTNNNNDYYIVPYDALLEVSNIEAFVNNK